MKTRLLAGLTALVLGGLTSCSNILEENGIPNSVAESGMGELRINLVADGTLDAMTKSSDNTAAIKTALETVNKNSFSINGTGTADDKSISFTGNPTELQTGKKVPAGTYTSITAELTSNVKIGFNAPHFKGEINNVKVTANQSTTNQTIEVKLQNSVITVNKESFGALSTNGQASITELYVVDPENNSKHFDLLTNEKKLKEISLENLLFVAPNEYNNAKIVISGNIPGYTQGFTKESTIEFNQNQAQNYEITYTISKDNGTLYLTVNINGEVTTTPVSVNIDPYNPAN